MVGILEEAAAAVAGGELMMGRTTRVKVTTTTTYHALYVSPYYRVCLLIFVFSIRSSHPKGNLQRTKMREEEDSVD